MSDPITFEIKGLKSARKALDTMEFRIRRNIVQSATRAGMGVLRAASRRAAPADTGLLRRQLSVSVKTDRVTGTVTGTLKPKRTKKAKQKGTKHSGHYHHIVIGGSKPHVIPGGVIGGNYYTRIEHPGIPGRPWMDEVINQNFRAAIVAFEVKLDERIIKEANKLHARQRMTAQ